MNCVKTTDSLPLSGQPVLGWSRHVRSGYCIAYWLVKPDLPDGRLWVINGSSGGIMDDSKDDLIKPPSHWRLLPERP